MPCAPTKLFWPDQLPLLNFICRSVSTIIALIICATYGTIASACLNVVCGLRQWITARAFKWTSIFFTVSVGIKVDHESCSERLLTAGCPAVPDCGSLVGSACPNCTSTQDDAMPCVELLLARSMERQRDSRLREGSHSEGRERDTDKNTNSSSSGIL